MRRLNRNPHVLRIAGAAGALAAALVLASCSGGASTDSASGGQLKVVATTTQLQDFAAEVGGDSIELTGLLAPGGSAHHFDPSPADLLALGEADVLVVNGEGLETFLDGAIEASGFSGEIVTAADGIDEDEARAITAESGEAAHDHDHEHAEEGADHDHAAETDSHDHADHDHADHDHDKADQAEAEADHDHADHAEDGADHDHAHEGHDHGDINPHIWTSPRNAIGMVDAVAKGLASADPDHAPEYEQRAAAYTEKLAALDTWVGAQFERVPAKERVLVSGHDSLTYFLHDYGITFAGSILPSFEDNAEPSAADVDALVAKIKEQGVKAVFVESSMSPKLARTIADEAGVAVVDSESLYADSLGKPGSDADTYIGATVANTRTILGAWGAEVDETPDTID